MLELKDKLLKEGRQADYYAELRVIVASSPNGNHESVYFTEDFETPADELMYMGDMTISSDMITDVSLPGIFPLDYELRRH